MKKHVLPIGTLSVLLASMVASCSNQTSDTSSDDGFWNSVYSQFQTPPNAAKPRVWWHWMNGNVTKEGIDKDLTWLANTGIGGVQNFDANLQTPQIVENRLVYMQPDWKDAFVHAVTKADELGLEFAIAASPGWSETGGPWVKPENGMKKVVWAGFTVKGGEKVVNRNMTFPVVTGPFQSLEYHDLFGGEHKKEPPSASGTIAYLAVPLAHSPDLPEHRFSSQRQTVDGRSLQDNDLNSAVAIVPDEKSGLADITVDFEQPATLRAATLFLKNAKPPFSPPKFTARLQAKIDGNWHPVGDFAVSEASSTIGFPATTASSFRVLVSLAGRNTSAGSLGSAPGAETMQLFPSMDDKRIEVGDFSLFANARLSHSESKAGYDLAPNYYALADESKETGALPEAVIDLSPYVNEAGQLTWQPPHGHDWRIVSIGWSLTGKTNHPATPEATGLEVDKYDAAAVSDYMHTYINMYRDVVGKDMIGKKGIQALLTDSIEVGASNWTPALLSEFKARRGYDPLPWLPVISGEIIGSVKRSEQFLFDYRQTLGELLAEAHYSTVADVAHQYDLKVYGEAMEDGRPVLGDDLAMRRYADIPMAALWTFAKGQEPRQGLLGDMKGASSVAHFYGKSYVAAESMTSAFSPWAFAPKDLKHVIDMEFAYGINRPVIHTSVHQPVDDKVPGLSLAVFGQYFNRHETWASMAKPWISYLSRSSYLLQQGRNVADVAVFFGQDTPVATLYSARQAPVIPAGYAYDMLNNTMLVSLSVKGNRLESPAGAQYRALFLAGTSEHMTMDVLLKIRDIAQAGIPVLGSKPVASPNLMDDKKAFDELAGQVWSLPNVFDSTVDATEDMLKSQGITADIAVSSNTTDSPLFIHRALDKGDIYYLYNPFDAPIKGDVVFGVSGRKAQIWDAVTGLRHDVSYRQQDSRTSVTLSLPAHESVFVVFSDGSGEMAKVVTPSQQSILIPSIKHWKVTFEDGRGAPEQIEMDSLTPLNSYEQAGIRYYSGISTYSTEFNFDKALHAGDDLWLDLGDIGDVAEVYLNGQRMDTVWHAPFKVKVDGALLAGSNSLTVKVANLWVNRLIGDKQPGAEKVAWVAAPTYQADAPLRPSGLLGPVSLRLERQ